MDVKTLSGSAPRTESTATSTAKPRGTASAGAGMAAQGGVSSEESLTLTAVAKSMTAAKQGATEVPFDAAKVAEIRAAIAEDRYPIDNEALASSILRLEGLLSGA
jgi:negative regulator of flagellin synthesis FlgM